MQPDKPVISILVPLLNEEESLPELNERLRSSLEGFGKSYELIYINDGSTDTSQELLESFRNDDARIKIIEFNRNYGQHMALFAGFERAQGEIIVTIDADLQNPPEEIPRLVSKMDDGYDVVATYRRMRQDSLFRKLPSFIVNKITSRLVGVKLRDYGCMLRAYSRSVINSINMCQESSSFIPALANTYAKKIVEIEVGHEERKKGTSKYSLFQLLRLNFDLMTGFSLLPIQWIGMLGVIIAAFASAAGATKSCQRRKANQRGDDGGPRYDCRDAAQAVIAREGGVIARVDPTRASYAWISGAVAITHTA